MYKGKQQQYITSYIEYNSMKLELLVTISINTLLQCKLIMHELRESFTEFMFNDIAKTLVHQMSVEKTDGNYPCGLHHVCVLLMVVCRLVCIGQLLHSRVHNKSCSVFPQSDNSLGKLVHKSHGI